MSPQGEGAPVNAAAMSQGANGAPLRGSAAATATSAETHRASGTVMITAGGTGGHVFPGLAVAAKLVGRGWRVFWLGTRDGMEGALVRGHGVEFEGVAFGGVRGKGWKTAVFGPLVLLAACWQSGKIIRRRAPDVVLGFGGFASFPGALAGVALARPLVLHEANAIAGLANRVLAYVADRILLGFPDAMRGRHAAKVEWVGIPVRDAISRLPSPEARFAGRVGPLRLLVVGGSLGAAAINRCVPQALALLPAANRPQVVHQSGARHIDALRAAYEQAGVVAQCVPFIEDIATGYAEADVVLCRGGAVTVAELAAAGVASIIVPLPGAIADEQSANARLLVDAGAAFAMAQDELTASRLAAHLGALTRVQLLAMATAARTLARIDAADRVAGTCVALGTHG
jgi:UDP-N-acetylglucosamine--N-acetylmuramyl-(pentapeptide) pyrophosphoryl-undecaprenol N-acetylglucosamine transferase